MPEAARAARVPELALTARLVISAVELVSAGVLSDRPLTGKCAEGPVT
jgi:hypothetical protein